MTPVSGAEKTIAIKIAQYATSIDFMCRDGATWNMGEKTGGIKAADTCSLSGTLLKRAVKRYHVLTNSVKAAEVNQLDEFVAEWRSLGFSPKIEILGEPLYTDDGKTLIHDGRLAVVNVGTFADMASAQALVDRLAAQGKSSWIQTEVVSRSEGRMSLKVNGSIVAEGTDLLLVPQQLVLLKKVEYAVGYPWHGFADRSYRGSLMIQWGAYDAMDCILKTPMEMVLAGVVPSEISAKAEIGALQAQACAARGEILAKIGKRHPGEGFDTCSEQHCQVFAGESTLSIEVGRKIAPAKGWVLTTPQGGLVDAVYAANCGGRGEASHYVWTGPENPILRGVWDADQPPNLDLSEEKQVGVFLTTHQNCYCNNPTVEGGTNFRWQKTLNASDWKAIESAIGVGRIKTITDIARGFSGRIYRLTFVGERGNKTVMKELALRKLMGGLKSSCFIATWNRDAAGFIVSGELIGGGFGHGVGMCQTGAQALGKKNYSFDRILMHYFPGSILKKLY
jgi:SpoIID/LytB domain protein